MFIKNTGILILLCVSIFADEGLIDLGIRGQLYEIKEKSFKEEIAERTKKIDITKWEKELIEDSKKTLIVKSNIENCTENKNYIYDPSFKIEEDIKIPYQEKILYKKGYEYNPLKENNIKFNKYQIFIDADDTAQLMMAVKYAKKADIFVIKGDISKLFKYQEQGYIFREAIEGKAFKINCLPTIYAQDNLKFNVNEYNLNEKSEEKK